MKELDTWAGKGRFRYSGSVGAGTEIAYGARFRSRTSVSAAAYAALLQHGRTVSIGTSRTTPPAGSVGEWLNSHVTRTAIASYVGPILLEGGYAERVREQSDRIRFL